MTDQIEFFVLFKVLPTLGFIGETFLSELSYLDLVVLGVEDLTLEVFELYAVGFDL